MSKQIVCFRIIRMEISTLQEGLAFAVIIRLAVFFIWEKSEDFYCNNLLIAFGNWSIKSDAVKQYSVVVFAFKSAVSP